MLWKQDMLEKQLAALQQLVRELSTVNKRQVHFKKPSLEATRMPTIEEEDTDEDEDPTNTKKKTNTDDKDDEHSTKKKSKPLRRLLKNLRSFLKIFK